MTRKLDALFAERVLGCKVEWPLSSSGHKLPACFCDDRRHSDPPWLVAYSTDLSTAWEGVERLLTNGAPGAGPSLFGGRWKATIDTSCQSHSLGLGKACADIGRYPGGSYGQAHADSVPLAIVLACLRAVGVSEEEIEEAQAMQESCQIAN